MHEPLSQRLARILEAESVTGSLSLNQLLLRTEGRGLYLVMIILCAPFITPIPLPGLSSLVGAVVILLAIRLALGLPPALPRFMGERAMPPGFQNALLRGSVKLLRWIERVSRPRKTQWLGWPITRLAHAILIIFMALLLSLPIPPVIPFSNTLPALAIIILAVSMMEEDGLMIWIGYLAALATILWLGLSAGVIVTLVVKFYDQIMQYLRPQP